MASEPANSRPDSPVPVALLAMGHDEKPKSGPKNGFKTQF